MARGQIAAKRHQEDSARRGYPRNSIPPRRQTAIRFEESGRSSERSRRHRRQGETAPRAEKEDREAPEKRSRVVVGRSVGGPCAQARIAKKYISEAWLDPKPWFGDGQQFLICTFWHAPKKYN